MKDQKKWEKLRGCEEEIGKNCLLGGDSVYDAIERKCFERSGHFRSCETISLSKKASEEVRAAVKDLKYGDISPSSDIPFPIKESIQQIQPKGNRVLSQAG